MAESYGTALSVDVEDDGDGREGPDGIVFGEGILGR